jgi:AcrR family transcriptional regulator
MTQPVKPRPYHAPHRRAAAQATRRAILDAAARLFVERGYSPTTMAAIAEAASVALDTLYAAVGPKPVLFRLLVETAISGTEEPVPALEREYVHAIYAERDPRRKLELYAQAVRRTQERLAPLFRVLQQAAPMHPELMALWEKIAQRRARNMRMLATDLAETGRLRPGVTIDEAADAIWAMNSSEFYVLLVHERGWAPERYERWLGDAWTRLLLQDQGGLSTESV